MAKTLLEAQLERAKHSVSKQEYNACVVALIRAKYTKDDENAIIRKKLANIDNGEFDAFNTYVEECKAKIKAEYTVVELN